MEPAPLKVPGFGLPVNHRYEFGHYFPSAIIGMSHTPSHDLDDALTVRELTMLHLMDSITDKPDWDSKVFDEHLIKKWSQEARDTEEDITDDMLDYCFAELQNKALSFRKTGIISTLDCASTVVKSDSVIDLGLREALKEACVPLEQVADEDKDWHPGSDQKVLDLIHPSLYSLVYGKSKVLPLGKMRLEDCEDYIGDGQLVEEPDEEKDLRDKSSLSATFPRFYDPDGWRMPKNLWSRAFQWLPCDVAFHNHNEIRISSYINNLHPGKHRQLYSVIEEILSRVIPLWDEVLSAIKTRHGPRICVYDTSYDWPQGVEPPEDYLVPDDERDYYGSDDSSRRACWEKSTRVLMIPEPRKYEPRTHAERDRVSLKAQFAVQGLQIIVKLANIELTPEKPNYEGGSWHVEGQMNERICASAIYYYDSNNITDSFLGFRHQVNSNELRDKAYDQWDCEGVEQMYGIEQGGPALQKLGRVLTREGRLVAFPNVLHHRVSPFRLADSTKAGHRKILALFLVDPHNRILSTANVPPQQRSWLRKEILEESHSLLQKTSTLPNELIAKIIPYISYSTMTLEEAKKLRLKLMEERRASVENVEDHLQSWAAFNFCEH